MSLLRAVRAVARPAASSLTHCKAAAVTVPCRSVGSAAAVVDGPENPLDGRQREEYDLELSGVQGFDQSPAYGPFGTIQQPTKIYSGLSSRIVGCKGGDDLKHRLGWMEVRIGQPHVCIECGQVFKLVSPLELAKAKAEHQH